MLKNSTAKDCSNEFSRHPCGTRRLRAGQLGVIVIGRIIMGAIAVTLVDLAQRRLLTVNEAEDDGGWLLSPAAAATSRRQQNQLLGYEKRLLGALAEVDAPSRLSALANRFETALDETREALVREAVHQGWLRHLHHDQRTPKGEDLARQVRSFRRDLRRLKADSDQESWQETCCPILCTLASCPTIRYR